MQQVFFFICHLKTHTFDMFNVSIIDRMKDT